MSNIDEAAQVIAEAVADTMSIGGMKKSTYVQMIKAGLLAADVAAQALADAGLLMPELPEPNTAATDPEWEQKYLKEYEWVPDAEWHPTDEFFINVKDGNVNAGFWEAQENWEGMNPTDLKAIALALLAAAQWAEKEKQG